MKIVVDGHEIDCDEVRLSTTVASVDGILEESQLNLTLTEEGLIMDLDEVTDTCNGSSCEVTRTFSGTFEDLVSLLE